MSLMFPTKGIHCYISWEILIYRWRSYFCTVFLEPYKLNLNWLSIWIIMKFKKIQSIQFVYSKDEMALLWVATMHLNKWSHKYVYVSTLFEHFFIMCRCYSISLVLEALDLVDCKEEGSTIAIMNNGNELFIALLHSR